MSDSSQLNNTNSSNISQETEDGEIEEFSGTASENVEYDTEVNEYYKILNNIGSTLRCRCCSEVFSDPVKLKCDHLIDRSCVASKLNSNVIICPTCQKETTCEDVDDLLTDFDIAAQIPPKPNALIEMINKQGGVSSKPKRPKLDPPLELSDDGEYELINGVKVKRDKSIRRRKKTRWSAIDEKPLDFQIVDPQLTVSGMISDILASHNPCKNITISQFKKYTEISGKADIMSALTEAVMQNSKTTDLPNNEKISQSLSDKEILEMIPMNEFDDLFELEKVQLILLYREALDKGVLMLPSPKKTLVNSSSKQALLPTPKTSSNGSVESQENPSPVSSRKRYTSESSKSSNISCRSSAKSALDSSGSESPTAPHKHSKKKYKNRKDSLKTSSIKSDHSTNKNLNSIQMNENSASASVSANVNILNIPSSTSENLQLNQSNSKSISNECQKMCDNIRYRDDINRLHTLYSTMYHASLKMKDFENKIDSEDYQNSYKIYCENYAEYQILYSNLQSVINIDSISADKTDSISNSYTGSEVATPLVNGINVTVSAHNQEQASSTISPALYAPDSTDSIPDNTKTAGIASQNPEKINYQSNMNNFRSIKKEKSLDSKKKFGYLWISNLSKEVRTNDICRTFGKFGHISKVKLFQYKAQIPPTYFGLVFMPNYNEAENAFHQLQNKFLNDKQIHIKMLENNPLSGDRVI